MEIEGSPEARRKTLKSHLTKMKKIDKLFAHKGKWHKGSYFADKKGNSIGLHEVRCDGIKPYSFCLLGAVQQVAYLKGNDDDNFSVRFPQYIGLETASGVIGYNDKQGRSFVQIKKRIARGIKAIEKLLSL